MDFSELYILTLPVIGTQNLVMGFTLLMFHGETWIKNVQYELAVRFMGLAMLIMSVINYVECFIPTYFIQSEVSTSVLVFAAAIELFLMWYTYIALLSPHYITRIKIFYEILLILLFTMPPLLIDSNVSLDIHRFLFYLSVTYYVVKFVVNILIFRKQYQRMKASLCDFYSDGEKFILNWIRKTFNIVLVIGAISILIPFTNYCVMFFYQLFLFLAYFYIYYQIIVHESLFNKMNNDSVVSELETTKIKTDGQVDNTEESVLFSFDKWIADRYFAKPGITIEDVASQLKTNRTTLSLYLNSQLKMNFYEWISKIRIEHAKKIIEETPALPIPEVATHVGIEDRSNFDKLFKRIVGVSPATYRLQFLRKKLN